MCWLSLRAPVLKSTQYPPRDRWSTDHAAHALRGPLLLPSDSTFLAVPSTTPYNCMVPSLTAVFATYTSSNKPLPQAPLISLRQQPAVAEYARSNGQNLTHAGEYPNRHTRQVHVRIIHGLPQEPNRKITKAGHRVSPSRCPLLVRCQHKILLFL